MEWDIIQGLDVRTLLCTYVVTGRDREWETAVGAICSSDVCRTVGDLFANLKTVKRAVCWTTHVKVLLFSSQSLIREAGLGMTDEGLIRFAVDVLRNSRDILFRDIMITALYKKQ